MYKPVIFSETVKPEPPLQCDSWQMVTHDLRVKTRISLGRTQSRFNSSMSCTCFNDSKLHGHLSVLVFRQDVVAFQLSKHPQTDKTFEIKKKLHLHEHARQKSKYFLILIKYFYYFFKIIIFYICEKDILAPFCPLINKTIVVMLPLAKT